MADGQVTRGNEIVKPNVKKVRKLNDSVIGGFAGMLNNWLISFACHPGILVEFCTTCKRSCATGATADAFTLFERLEMQLEQHPGEPVS